MTQKNRHLGTIAQICRAISSQVMHVSTIGKKLAKQHLLHMTLQCDELRPTSGWDHFVSLGRPSKFQRVSRLGFVTAATSLNGSQPNFARCLAVSCAATLYIHFWRLLPRNGILPSAKFSLLPPSLALCWGVWGTPANFNGFCILAALLHGTRAVGASQTLQRWSQGATYIWQGDHHVGHWPTF